MDIGARCKECFGRGSHGGSAPFAHPGIAVRTPCYRCDGAGRNDAPARQPSTDLMANEDLARAYADQGMASVEHWRFSLGRD